MDQCLKFLPPYWLFRLLVCGALACSLLSCAPPKQPSPDSIGEHQVRRSLDALMRVERFEPATDPDIPSFVDSAAETIKKTVLLAIFVRGNEACLNQRASAPLVECWERWREGIVADRSDVDELVYGLGPWMDASEVQLILSLLPDSVPGVETDDVNDVITDEQGVSHRRTLPDANVIDGRNDIKESIKTRLVDAIRLRHSFEMQQRFVSLVERLPPESLSWLGLRDLVVPPNLGEPIAIPEGTTLSELLAYERAKVAWTDEAARFLARVEAEVDARLEYFGFLARSDETLYPRLRKKLRTLLSASRVAAKLYDFRRSSRSCTFDSNSACVLSSDDEGALGNKPRFAVTIRNEPLSDINRRATFGLAEFEPVRLVVGLSSHGIKGWQAKSQVSMSLKWDAVLGIADTTGVEQVRSLDFGVIATDVEATAFSEPDRPIEISALEGWRFWPANRSAVLAWIEDRGLPPYLAISEIELQRRNDGFVISARASMPSLGGAVIANVPLELPVDEDDARLERLWASIVSRLVLQVAEASPSALSMPSALQEDFDISAIAVRRFSPLQLTVDAHPHDKPTVSFSMDLRLDGNGEWQLDTVELGSVEALVASRVSKPESVVASRQQSFVQSTQKLQQAVLGADVPASIAEPEMLGRLLMRTRSGLSVDDALKRTFVAGAVMRSQQLRVTELVTANIQSAEHPVRQFALLTQQVSYSPATPAEMASVVSPVNRDSPVQVDATAALLSAVLHDYQLVGGDAKNAPEMVVTWVKEAVSVGLKRAIEQRWRGGSAFACIESPSGCPMPAIAETSAMLVVHKYLSGDVNSQPFAGCDDLPQSIDQVTTRRLPVLMMCASHFGVGEAEFAQAREAFVASLNSTIKKTLTTNWKRYAAGVASEFDQLAASDTVELLGQELIDHLKHELPGVNSSQLEGLVKDATLVVVEAQRLNRLDAPAAQLQQELQRSLRNQAAKRINRWVSEAADDVILPAAYQERLDGRSVEEVIASVAPGLVTPMNQAIEAERAYLEARATWLEAAMPEDIVVRSLNVTHHDGRIEVSAQVLPSVGADLSIRYPSETHVAARAATTLLRSGVEAAEASEEAAKLRTTIRGAQASARALEETFAYSREQLADLLEQNLGEVFQDYFAACRSIVEPDELCRDPDALWQKLTGSSLADWPLEVMVELNRALDAAAGRSQDAVIAAGRAHLESVLGPRCDALANVTVAGVGVRLRLAASTSCVAAKDHLSQYLPMILSNCDNSLQRADGTACLADVHDVVIKNFVSALQVDDVVEQAAWTYVLEQAVALDAKLATLPSWVLQPPVTCIDPTDLSIEVAQPNQCGDRIEIANFAEAEAHVRDLHGHWRRLEARVKTELKNQAALCLTQGPVAVDPPVVSLGREGCEGVVVDSVDSVERYVRDAGNAAIAELRENVSSQLNQVCVNTVTDAGIQMPENTQCLTLEDLADPKRVESRITNVIKDAADRELETVTETAIEHMQAMAASYGVDVVIVDGKYCVNNSFLGLGGFKCDEDFATLLKDIEEAWQDISNLDVDRLTAMAVDEAKRRALDAASRELSEQCIRFREALANSDLKLFGADLDVDFDGNECPDKGVRVKGTAIVAGVSVDVKAGLQFEGGELSLDWQRLETNPTPEALVTRLIEREIEDVEVLSVDIAREGVKVRVRYYPPGFPWPVKAVAVLGDRPGLELDLNLDFDRLWQITLAEVCVEIGNYVREEQLELLPDMVIADSVDGYCAERKMRGLKFRVDATLADPLGKQSIFVIVDSRSGIAVETPDFRDLLAQNLANFLKLADVGVTPANPWYTTEDGLTLHLDVSLPIPVIELKAETSLAISRRQIKFKSPVRLRIDQWIDTSTVSFGRFALGYEPKERSVELAGSATFTLGAVNQYIFRVDGSATFNVEAQEILVEGSSRVATIVEVSNTKTRINFSERLFEHSVGTGPMLDDLIRMQGTLKIQDRPGVDFVRANGTGELFGARIASMNIGLGRRLDGEFNVYLNLLDVAKQRFHFKVKEDFQDPRVETSIAGLNVGSSLVDLKVSASRRNARVTLEALGLEISQDVASLADIDEELLEDLLKKLLIPGFGLRIGSLESGATLVSFSDEEEGDGDDADDGETSDALVGDDAAVDAPPVVGSWNNAFRVDKVVKHYRDCWDIGIKVFCKKKQRTKYNKVVAADARGVAAALGINSFNQLKKSEARYRQLQGSALLQFAYKTGSAPRYVVFDTGQGKVVWQGTYGCATGNCYCYDATRAPQDPPALAPIHFISANDKSYLLVAADDGPTTYGFVNNGDSLANASCPLGSSTNTTLAKINRDKDQYGKKAALGLFELVLRETSIRGRKVAIVAFGDETDPHLLEMESAGRRFLLHHDPEAPGYYWIVSLPAAQLKGARNHLLNRFDAARAAFDEVCATSTTQSGPDRPCAFARFASSDEGDTFAIIERGIGRSERKLALVPADTSNIEAPLRANLEINGDIEPLTNDSHPMSILFDRFIVGMNPRSIKRVAYTDTFQPDLKQGMWLANYVDAQKEQAIRLADDAIRIGQDEPLITFRRWTCIKTAILSTPGLAPEEFANSPDPEQFADLLLARNERWPDAGWKANPLGYMRFKCQ